MGFIVLFPEIGVIALVANICLWVVLRRFVR